MGSMDEGEINKQRRELVEQLKHENAHTPPSLRLGLNRKNDHDENNKGMPGQR